MEIPKRYKIKNKIWIEDEMFYSEAYHSISRSGSAINTLMRCLQKRKWETGRKRKIIYTDDGFVFPYAEAEALKIAKTTQYWKNLIKLVEVGFLDVVHPGGWYQKHEKEKDYSVYKLSERWRKYGTPEFEKAEKPKRLQKHLHIRENIARQKLKSTSLERRGQLHGNEDDRQESVNDRLHKSEVEVRSLKSRQSFDITA